MKTVSSATSPEELENAKPRARADIAAVLSLLGNPKIFPSSRSDKLRFHRCDLMGVRLEDKEFADLEFSECHFEGAAFSKCRFANVSFRRCAMQHTSFSYNRIRESEFSESALPASHFYEAEILWTAFWRADCRGADFRGATLEKSVVTEANLSGADFAGAMLKGLHVREAETHGANFSDCDMTEVEKLTQEQVDVAVGNVNVKLPINLTQPKQWSSVARQGPTTPDDLVLVLRKPLPDGNEIAIGYSRSEDAADKENDKEVKAAQRTSKARRKGSHAT